MVDFIPYGPQFAAYTASLNFGEPLIDVKRLDSSSKYQPSFAFPIRKIVRPILAFVLVISLWEILVRLSGVSPIILPPPSAVAEKIVTLHQLLLNNVLQTTLESIAGLFIAIALGVVLAAVLVSSEFLDDCLYPNLVILQIIPKIALAPLFVAYLGFAPQSRILFSVFLSFFPIFLATYTGLRQVSTESLKLCRAMRASPSRVLFKLRFPYAVPFIFSGMKTTATLSVIGVVVGEFIASQGGLGYLILFFSSQQQTDVSIAAIVCLCGVGALIYAVVSIAERLVNQRLGLSAQATH